MLLKFESRLVRVSSMLSESTKFPGKALYHLGKACCLAHTMAVSILEPLVTSVLFMFVL